MDHLIAEMARHGYKVNNIIIDGTIKRFKLDENDDGEAGWYVAFENRTKSGTLYHYLVYHDWRQVGEPKKYCDLNGEATEEDHQYIKEQYIKSSLGS